MCHKVTYRGWRMCSDMPPTIELFERRMREERGWAANRRLRIFQGSYNTTVTQSSDTHAGAGALDTEKLDDAGTKIARECGTTSWQRGDPEDTFFDDHNHWIFIGCTNLSRGAGVQVASYKNGKNGLANGGPDKSPRVSPIRTCQQALVHYADKPTKPDEGTLGMSTIVKPHATVDQKITDNGEWQVLRVDDEDGHSLLTGPVKLYVASVHWAISDLAIGDVAQFRLCIVNDDVSSANKPTVIEYSYPISETHGSEGSSFGELSWINDIGGDKAKNVKRRLRLYCRPPGKKSMTITDVTSRVAH